MLQSVLQVRYYTIRTQKCISLLFQSEAWAFSDGSPVYMVPRSYSSSMDLGHQSIVLDHNIIISTNLNASQTELLRTSSGDKLCSAATMDSSLSRIFFFPVPCDEPVSTRVTCQTVPKMPKYDRGVCLPEPRKDHSFGTVQMYINSSTLVLSPINCPYSITFTELELTNVSD